jgi:hypothetical protein
VKGNWSSVAFPILCRPGVPTFHFSPFTVPDHQQIQCAGLVAHDRRRGHVGEYFSRQYALGIDMAKDDLVASSRRDGRG